MLSKGEIALKKARKARRKNKKQLQIYVTGLDF